MKTVPNSVTTMVKSKLTGQRWDFAEGAADEDGAKLGDDLLTRVKYYSHRKRARRSKSKEDAVRPFVYEYCHNNDYSRAAREDT